MNNLKLNTSFYLLLFLLVGVDFLALWLSFGMAKFLQQEEVDIALYSWILILILFTFAAGKIYVIRYDFWGDAKKMLKGFFFSFLAVFTVISLAKISDEYSVSFLLKFFVIAMFVTLFLKRLFKQSLFSFDFFKIRVKVMADKENYKTISNEIRKNWYFGYTINDDEYDMVIISSRGFDINYLQESINEFSRNTKDIYIIPYLDNLNFTHTTIVDFSNIRFSALHIENRLLNYKNIFIKYFFEKIVVLLLFPFALILHIFIRYMIKTDSKGDVFFIQQRLGKDFKIFNCYKYRTMYEDSKNILDEYLLKKPDEVEYFKKYHKYRNDPRITKVGNFLRKTSLDELPQFYNILRGEMNLIGPRPYMLNELEDIDKSNQEIILKVKPGLTGLWQVSGRNELTFKKRVDLDLWYIQNWSLWMDFVIFLKTIKVVLFKVGAR
ncbi:MAG: sugar transferase [Sulfurimonas sp.]|jgi:undecaprenyl-phosphate galactose phosphotransferase|uniref:sugar transferase n=3 Tax=unclassified Sulfurimonas TaxID=2623549 RepID=UPI001BBAE831|nr:sugar transferase [Sulfurimonas sp.]MBS4067749.1 sugar transferase [Sulfurimonas sp.]MDD3854331.1 sugar transferase [Sulfurimonas sp.]MDX9756172.1 sugar transferase [Sulfurimonas sp.]